MKVSPLEASSSVWSFKTVFPIDTSNFPPCNSDETNNTAFNDAILQLYTHWLKNFQIKDLLPLTQLLLLHTDLNKKTIFISMGLSLDHYYADGWSPDAIVIREWAEEAIRQYEEDNVSEGVAGFALLGLSYETRKKSLNGKLETDYASAVHAYKRGVKNNDALCYYLLARCYLLGKGVAQNVVLVQSYLEKAIHYEKDPQRKGEYNFTLAQLKGKGVRYIVEIGPPPIYAMALLQDIQLAIPYYFAGAANGHPQAIKKFEETQILDAIKNWEKSKLDQILAPYKNNPHIQKIGMVLYDMRTEYTSARDFIISVDKNEETATQELLKRAIASIKDFSRETQFYESIRVYSELLNLSLTIFIVEQGTLALEAGNITDAKNLFVFSLRYLKKETVEVQSKIYFDMAEIFLNLDEQDDALNYFIQAQALGNTEASWEIYTIFKEEGRFSEASFWLLQAKTNPTYEQEVLLFTRRLACYDMKTEEVCSANFENLQIANQTLDEFRKGNSNQPARDLQELIIKKIFLIQFAPLRPNPDGSYEMQAPVVPRLDGNHPR